MFIKAANSRVGTGFTGDVNTAFRQGREDAFQDYIKNFNIALQADAKNNAENQLAVQRAAQNYGLNLKFDDATRKAMLDTVKDSQNIADAKFDFLVDASRLDNLYPQAEALGVSKANAVTNEAIAKEVDFANKASRATYQQDGMKQEGNNYLKGLDVKGSELGNKQTAEGMTAEAYSEANQLAKMTKWTQQDWINSLADELWSQAKLDPNNAGKSKAELLNELRANGMFDTALESYKADKLKQAQDTYYAYARKLSNVASEKSAGTTKSTTTKEAKTSGGGSEILDKDGVRALTGGKPLGFTANGLEVLALPNGDILVKDDSSGYRLKAMSRNGKVLGPEEILELNNIKVHQQKPQMNMPNDVRG